LSLPLHPAPWLLQRLQQYTKLTLILATINLVVSLVLSAVLELSISDRVSWLFVGLYAVYGAVGVLATFDMPLRKGDKATLDQHQQAAFQMLQEHSGLLRFRFLAAHVVRQLQSALNTA